MNTIKGSQIAGEIDVQEGERERERSYLLMFATLQVWDYLEEALP